MIYLELPVFSQDSLNSNSVFCLFGVVTGKEKHSYEWDLEILCDTLLSFILGSDKDGWWAIRQTLGGN